MYGGTNKKGLAVKLGLFYYQIIGRRDWTRTNDPHHVKVVL
jgi:hypothetical protein